MLTDYLADCHPIDSHEQHDYRDICCEMSANKLFVSYIPSIIFDLWPLYVLQCTSAKQYCLPIDASCVYLMPIGANNFWAKTEFERLVLDFYRNDEFPDNYNIYDFDLEEMILLQYPGSAEMLNLGEFGSCNAVYMRMSRDKIESHVIVLLENPSEGWKTIVERYEIVVDMLIDSHKGLGTWLEDSRLYSNMNSTEKSLLLPRYYFKGKYISQPAPEGFSLLMEVEESEPHKCVSKIYKTPWHSNF